MAHHNQRISHLSQPVVTLPAPARKRLSAEGPGHALLDNGGQLIARLRNANDVIFTGAFIFTLVNGSTQRQLPAEILFFTCLIFNVTVSFIPRPDGHQPYELDPRHPHRLMILFIVPLSALFVLCGTALSLFVMLSGTPGFVTKMPNAIQLNHDVNPFWCPEVTTEEYLQNNKRPGKENAPIGSARIKTKRAPLPSPAATLRVALDDKINVQIPKERKSSLLSTRDTVSPLAGQKRPVPLKSLYSKLTVNPTPWRPDFAPDRSHKKGSGRLGVTAIKLLSTKPSATFANPLALPYDSASFILSDRADALTMGPSAFQSSESNNNEFFPGENGSGLTRTHLTGQAYGSSAQILKTYGVQDPQVRALRNNLYGPELGPECPENVRRVVMQLDNTFSGMRFEQRIMAEGPQTYQAVVNFLADQGLLMHTVLHLFRSCPTITRLGMAQTMDSRGGLNEAGRDALKAFLLPNGFTSLAEIDFTGVQLSAHQLKQLVLLPALRVLMLASTGIDDLDLLPLTAFQANITELYLAHNPAITDNCLGVLSCVTFLHSLDVSGTGVMTESIRSLTGWFAEEDRSLLYLAMPEACRQHLKKQACKTMYCIDIPSEAPFVTRPEECEKLSIAGVKANLKKHAEYNSSITLRGPEPSIRKKFVKILTLRAADMVVKDYIDTMG
ncbi:hypothetical protein FRB99_002187 [Tulasnella sp. 403]|nr:hypothetical protein FRB99_002187 [Tulasnella sp. 403]